jgi:hypothetical protein
MGVTYWAYAWVSNNARTSIPNEFKEEFTIDWKEVKNNEEGIWWKLVCSPNSPYIMGDAPLGRDSDGHRVEDGDWAFNNAQDFQCISVDDSGYGGLNSNPRIAADTNHLVRWKTWTDAELEFQQMT